MPARHAAFPSREAGEPGETGTVRASAVLALVGAILGWLLATLLIVLGLRPMGSVLLVAALAAAVVVTVRAHRRGLPVDEVAACFFAAVLLSWPVLGVLTLLILNWTGVAQWG